MFDQWMFGQVVQFVDGVLGVFVVDVYGFCCMGDGVQFGDLCEQGDVLWVMGDVLGESGECGYGGFVMSGCIW